MLGHTEGKHVDNIVFCYCVQLLVHAKPLVYLHCRISAPSIPTPTFGAIFSGRILKVEWKAWCLPSLLFFILSKCSFQQVNLPSLLEQECHFKAYWMRFSFALGCQRWRCYGNRCCCYQSSTAWQVNHLFIWVMILSCLDIYSCEMIAEEQTIMSVSDLIGRPRLKEQSAVLTSSHRTRSDSINFFTVLNVVHLPPVGTEWLMLRKTSST